MPLNKIEWTRSQNGWGIWHITEPGDVLNTLALPEVCPLDVTSPLKRMEWAAGRILTRTLIETAGLAYQGLTKDALGKPHLNDHPHFISLSNAYPYVAAQLDSRHPVGIDIERPKPKLLKIAHRVFTKTESDDAGNDIIKNCIYWSAKEALFKIYGKKGLSFSDNLTIRPFELGKEGTLGGEITIPNITIFVRLMYRVTPEYVFVFTDSIEGGIKFLS